eukprot:1733424-Pyramimonas_sp.AAC.1
MPSFKSKMLELAKKKGIELCPESIQRLSSGSYAERAGEARPQIPIRGPQPPRPRAADQREPIARREDVREVLIRRAER